MVPEQAYDWNAASDITTKLVRRGVVPSGHGENDRSDRLRLAGGLGCPGRGFRQPDENADAIAVRLTHTQ
jgi:hypothetical protein